MRRLPCPVPLASAPALGAALALFAAATALVACDAAGPDPGPLGPTPIHPGTPDPSAIVAAAFEEIEGLFDLGFDAATESATAARAGTGPTPVALEPLRARVDTTTYTGVFDATNARGYLVTLQYRQPQGIGVWQARVQHARAVDHDGDATTAALDAVETVTLTFLTYAALDAFLSDLEVGAVPYLAGASGDAEASFAAYDAWRVAQVYSPAAGEAVVSYANAELRESVSVREPVVTRNSDGTGTVRDGGLGGAVRTRYFGADFAVAADGSVSGTLVRTLSTSGDAADGAVVSRNDYVDGSFRQTRQRGGDGVVIRENTVG